MIHIPRSGGTTFGRRILGQLFKIPINVEYKHIKYISNIMPIKKGVEIYGYNFKFERRSYYSSKLWKHSTAKEISLFCLAFDKCVDKYLNPTAVS